MTLFVRGLARAPVPMRLRAGLSDYGASSYSLVDGEGAIKLTDELFASYAYLYATQPWVFTAISKLARGIGRLPLKAYENDDDGARARLRTGELATLLRRPVPGVSPFAWKEALVGNIATYGSCIGVKVQTAPDALPDEIWPFSPVGWRIKGNGDYVYQPTRGRSVTFPAWRIWHPYFWAPGPYSFGLSPLEPLRRTIAVEDAAQRLAMASFANGARPVGVLNSKQRLRDDAIRRLRANLKRMHSGPDKAFNILFLTGDFSWLPMSHNLNESAVTEHRLIGREEIAAVYDLPQPAMGILDNANFASINALHLMLYQDSYGIWTTMLEESFAADILEPAGRGETQFVEFDLNGVLRGDITSRTNAYQRAVTTYLSVDEIRASENLPPFNEPWSMRPLIPKQMLPDAASASGTQNTPGTNTDPDSPEGATP